VSSFEHINFGMNGKYSKNIYENPNYYAFIMIFQIYRNVVLKIVHALGWFISLCFYHIVNLNEGNLQNIQELLHET